MGKELLQMLACPDCKANLKYNKDKKILRCVKCKKNYGVDEGIPIFHKR